MGFLMFALTALPNAVAFCFELFPADVIKLANFGGKISHPSLLESCNIALAGTRSQCKNNGALETCRFSCTGTTRQLSM